MSRLLFVYGTLMSRADTALGREQRARLAREGRSLGAAMIAARLYDLGAYPGITQVGPWPGPDARAQIVHGEVYELDDPARTFTWLDPYESIFPECAPDCEYRREMADVALAADPRNALRAQVYVYRAALGEAREVKGGRWRVRT
jgi:gamma-glutamylcyclotransferase (GGCT)/AIG2-like uncharacterized protein YtfP